MGPHGANTVIGPAAAHCRPDPQGAALQGPPLNSRRGLTGPTTPTGPPTNIMNQNGTASGFEQCLQSDPSTFGAGSKTRLGSSMNKSTSFHVCLIFSGRQYTVKYTFTASRCQWLRNRVRCIVAVVLRTCAFCDPWLLTGMVATAQSNQLNRI